MGRGNQSPRAGAVHDARAQSNMVMKVAANTVVVLVTAPDVKTARMVAKAVLKKHLAACANIVPKIESHYWWQGQLESSAEVLIILKSTKGRLAALESAVLENHPYDTPEVIALPLASGNEKYLRWVSESVRAK